VRDEGGGLGWRGARCLLVADQSDSVSARVLAPAQGYRRSLLLAVEKLRELSVGVEDSPAARRVLLEKCAKTSLNSKLIAR